LTNENILRQYEKLFRHAIRSYAREEIPLRIFFLFFSLWLGLLAAGCQPNAVESGEPIEITPGPIVETVSPNSGEPQMTPSPPADSGLQHLIEMAKADVAQRLSVSIQDVAVLESVSVTWSDASLGCPQEGMAYAQVLTPGYLIRLKSGEQEFEYHAGKSTTVIFCENPSPPVPGIPPDV
jgi:hypothetical protein